MIGVQEGRSARPSAKKVRHNKVHTARGLRDRRVRLSADTAIQFYDVQDRLGYERATEAVDWLLQKAKASIDTLFDTSSQQLQNMTNPGSQISAQQGGCHSESMLARAELEQTNPHNSLDGSLELPYVGNCSSSYNTLEFSATPYFQKILETNQNQKTNMFNCESSSSGEHFIWNVNSAPFFLQSSTPGHNDDSSRSSKLPLFQL